MRALVSHGNPAFSHFAGCFRHETTDDPLRLAPKSQRWRVVAFHLSISGCFRRFFSLLIIVVAIISCFAPRLRRFSYFGFVCSVYLEMNKKLSFGLDTLEPPPPIEERRLTPKAAAAIRDLFPDIFADVIGSR